MGSNTSSTVNQTSQKVRDVLLYSPVNKKKNHVSSQNPQMSMSSPTLTLEGRVLKSCLKKTTNSPQNASLPTLSPSVTGNRKSLYKTAYSSTSTLSTEETAAPSVDIECESSCSTSSSSSSEEQAALKQAASTTTNTATNQAIEGITKSGSNHSPQHGNNNNTRKNIQLAPIILSPTNSSNSSSPSSTGSRVQFADVRRSGSFSSITYTNYINNHRVVDLSPKKASPSSSSSATCSSPRRFSSSSAPSNSPRSTSVASGRMNLTISTSNVSSPTSTGSPTHHASNAKFQSPSSTGSSSSTTPTRQLSLFEMYNNANTNSPKSPSKNDSFRTHKDFSMSKSDSKSMKNLYASRFGSIFNPSLNTTIQVPLLSVTQPDAPPSFVYYPKSNRSAQYLDVR